MVCTNLTYPWFTDHIQCYYFNMATWLLSKSLRAEHQLKFTLLERFFHKMCTLFMFISCVLLCGQCLCVSVGILHAAFITHLVEIFKNHTCDLGSKAHREQPNQLSLCVLLLVQKCLVCSMYLASRSMCIL